MTSVQSRTNFVAGAFAFEPPAFKPYASARIRLVDWQYVCNQHQSFEE